TPGKYDTLIDYLVRSHVRAWHDPKKGEVDVLRVDRVLTISQEILKNLMNNQWPTVGGMFPGVRAEFVDIVATQGTWLPEDVEDGPNKKRDMLQSALYSLYHSAAQMPPDARLEMDGIYLTYEKYLSEGMWASSMYPEVIFKLLNPENGMFVS